MELIGYVALMLLGLVLGTLGMGGSMLAIPILVYVFSLNMVVASAYALFITGTTSLFGYVLKQKDDPTDVRTMMMFGLPSLTLSFVTRKWIVDTIPSWLGLGGMQVKKEDLLLMIFCALMMVSAVLMIRRGSRRQAPGAKPRPHLLFPAGMFAGLIAGLVGAGGGFLILPSLVILGGLSFSTAVATTLILISLNSLVGFCGDALNFSIQWPFLLQVTGFCFAGLVFGHLAKKPMSRLVHAQSFGWLMAAVALLIVVTKLLGGS